VVGLADDHRNSCYDILIELCCEKLARMVVDFFVDFPYSVQI